MLAEKCSNKIRKKNSVWECFSAMKEKFPHKLAIKTHLDDITYLEFYNRVAELSEYLENREIKKIALLFNQGLDAIITMFAALKSHITYIPLDPRLQDHRIKEVLDDSGSMHLIVDHYNLPKIISTDKDLEIHTYNNRVISLQRKRLSKLFPLDDTKDIAYILYTSGSTGTPKGVMQTQDNILRHVFNYSKALSINFNDNLSLFSMYTFDAAVMDIYTALLNGATLYPFDLRNDDVSSISKYLNKNRITILHMVPTLFRYLTNVIKKVELLKNVRYVVLGGEEVTISDCIVFRKKFGPNAVMINGYGPTECTVAFQYFITRQNMHNLKEKKVPIGRPLEGISFFLQYEGKQKKAGEIVLRGQAIARGYWNAPELSNASFKQCKETGENVFYTGDYGYVNKDGNLVYLGRKDKQLKINGYKVHLSEIESLTRSYSRVSNAVAISVKNKKNKISIVVFITSRVWCDDDTEKLKKKLQRDLPYYAQPSTIIPLDIFPMTLSGKIDRRALIKQHQVCNTSVSEKNKLLTEYESIVLKIYRKILSIKDAKLSITRSITELGGDSISILQILMLIQKKFSINLTFDELFRNSSISSLSGYIEKKIINEQTKWSSILAQKDNSSDCFFLSQSQLRYWYRIKGGLPSAALNVGYSIKIQGVLDIDLFRKSLNLLVRRHDVFKVNFFEKNNIPYQYLKNRKSLSIDVHVLKNKNQGDKKNYLKMLSDEMIHHNFELNDEHLFKMKILKIGKNKHVFIYVLHHLIVDGWSSDILLNELWTIYVSLKENKKYSLLKPIVQYKDYINWERTYYNNVNHEKKLFFWKMRFKSASLEKDIKRISKHDNAKIATHSFVINTKEKKALVNYAFVNKMTYFLIHWIICNLTLYAFLNKKNLCITVDITTRDYYKFEKTIGLFTNVLPLPVVLNPNLSINENNIILYELYIECYEKRIPFPILMDNLFPDLLLHYDELFPIAFVFQSDYKIKEKSNFSLKLQKEELVNSLAIRDLIFEVIDAKSTAMNIYYNKNKYQKCDIIQLEKIYQKITKIFSIPAMLKEMKLNELLLKSTEKNE